MTLSTANIAMQFAGKPLFENISVKFIAGCCYGLIGANGSGKSTFLKILSGELESSAGSVAHDTHERMSVLQQNQFAYEEQMVLHVVMQGHTRLWQVLQEKNAIYDNLEATEEEYMRASELEVEFGELDGYSAEAKAGELLLGLGIPLSYHAGRMSVVPPGLKLRVLLAQALFADPDILLLDEPTNNLDIHTIRWLENTLRTRQATMIVISHDRHFLNAVCTHMADMDYGTLRIYPGNYDSYMEASMLARQRLLAANAKASSKITQLQDFVRRFSANKSKAKQATSRLKQIDKLKVEEVKPSSRQHPFIRFEETKKLFRTVLEINRLSKAFAEPLIHRFKAVVESGERIAIVGQNGVGKTTLLKMLVGCLAPDEGHIRWSENAQLGYYPQDTAACFEMDMTLMDWLMQFKAAEEDAQIIRSVLGRLLFSGDDANKSVRVLSGGERGRMLYGQLILEKPNVIVMDEPTNHMDMETIESLNIALEKYPGTVLFVSHDREFVSSLATRIWEVTPAGIVDFAGSYDDYLVSQGLE